MTMTKKKQRKQNKRSQDMVLSSFILSSFFLFFFFCFEIYLICNGNLRYITCGFDTCTYCSMIAMVGRADTSITSQLIISSWWWEQLRSSLLASLIFIIQYHVALLNVCHHHPPTEGQFSLLPLSLSLSAGCAWFCPENSAPHFSSRLETLPGLCQGSSSSFSFIILLVKHKTHWTKQRETLFKRIITRSRSEGGRKGRLNQGELWPEVLQASHGLGKRNKAGKKHCGEAGWKSGLIVLPWKSLHAWMEVLVDSPQKDSCEDPCFSKDRWRGPVG